MRWTASAALAGSLAMSAASLLWSARRGDELPARPPAAGPPPSRADAHADAGREPVRTIAVEPAPGLDRAPGRVEPLPQNVFHVVPYNDWPLFEIKVLEGQRLKFRRVNGRWEGDRSGLTIQFETPAEVDVKQEDVEIAALEKQSAELAADVLDAELQKTYEAAIVRERNARQDFDRLDKLHNRTAASEQDAQRARNLVDLAVVQREQIAATIDKKRAQARLQVQLAEHRLRRAQGDLDLANFKRELSWGNVPHRGHDFEEVVVTRVSAAIGDVPSGARERRPWVEVIDDRVLQVRALLALADLERVAVGRPVRVVQGARTYRGEVGAVGIVADEATQRVPVLVRVDNHDRALRIRTVAEVDFVGPAPQ